MTRPIPTFTVEELERLNDVELPSLTNDEAVDLGLVAVALIREWDLNLAVDVVVHDDLVFRAKLKSTGPGNDRWLTGKAAVVRRFGEPSLLVRSRHLASGAAFEDRDDVDHGALKAFGGSVPLRVAGELVGTLTVSGEPDAVDHEVAAEALRRYVAGLRA